MRGVLFMVGYLLAAHSAQSWGRQILGIDFDPSWGLLGNSAGFIKSLLGVIPAVGMFVGMFVASGTALATPGLREKPLKLFGSNLIAFGLGNVSVFMVGSLIAGNDVVSKWADAIGDFRLRLLLFAVVPFSGVIAGTLLVLLHSAVVGSTTREG
jgi:hypothetical protein